MKGNDWVQGWLVTLDPSLRLKAEGLIDIFTRWGIAAPEDWMKTNITGDDHAQSRRLIEYITSDAWVESWLAQLEPEFSARARRLIEILSQLGAKNAHSWVHSEIMENIPQVARFITLLPLWPHIIDRYKDNPSWIDSAIQSTSTRPNFPWAPDGDQPFADAGGALKRLIEANVDPLDICRIARMVAYRAVFDTLFSFDGGLDSPADAFRGELPGITLAEVDSNGRLTGRFVASLHESILGMDPSGREGRPTSENENDGDHSQ